MSDSVKNGFLFGPNGDRSSKRLGAIFCIINAAALSYIGIFYLRDIKQVLPLVVTWGGYALALWGIAAWTKT